MSGVALHSFQNGMVSVRVPGATAPSRSAGAKRSSPPRSPAGRRILQLEDGESEVESRVGGPKAYGPVCPEGFGLFSCYRASLGPRNLDLIQPFK